MTKANHAFEPYQLTDRYTRRQGRVFLTGTQALVRIMLDQARRDEQAGRNTAGFVSGYRGSPLGGLDQELWRARDMTEAAKITFMPAVNEDLGATAVLGAQQAVLDSDCAHEGVFSMWYGKGPGVDRSGDALKHGNAYGSSPMGGVLVVAGDDHGCVSSSMPHQSDVAFMAWFMPTLNPASVAEYLTFGAYGIALSRFSGTWVGFKAISETVESGASVELPPDPVFAQPDYTAPQGGLHIRASDLPSPDIETRIQHKLDAVRAFVEANPIDRCEYNIPDARFGFVTTGKAHLDLLEALRLLGLDASACRRLGIDIYKVGMVWPLARRDARAFVRGKTEIMVIEEKRGIIESQLKEAFYDLPRDIPDRMVGKQDETGAPLVPWTGELSPRKLAPLIAARLHPFMPEVDLPARAMALTRPPQLLSVSGATRTPYFCSGCPHNTSTKVPAGSRAASGIGCHVMASWMDRDTGGYAQMGGEGVPSAAASRFTGGGHIFQNLGEGTWYHSGSLAVRQAVAAGANITYKILYNDAVAMTGGQTNEGGLDPYRIVDEVRAMGCAHVAVVYDDKEDVDVGRFPSGVDVQERANLQVVQERFAGTEGVSVIVYVQTCAAEKRRRRKRGTFPDIDKRVFINTDVCEGCGDCGVQSNCVSIVPVETELGRKRAIDQSSCNKDFSCVKGFCPSFVTLEGAQVKKQATATLDLPDLPMPALPAIKGTWNVVITGVGGTGVVTIGAVMAQAAHIDGKGAGMMEMAGLAQKGGAVHIHCRLANDPADISAIRVATGECDALIGGDLVVSAGAKTLGLMSTGRTGAVVNSHEIITGDFTRDTEFALPTDRLSLALEARLRDRVDMFDASDLAKATMGDSIFSNMMIFGAAWQRGLVPLSLDAIRQAIDLNGAAVDKNMRAFDIGRWAVLHPEDAGRVAEPKVVQLPKSLDDKIAFRADHLVKYQGKRLAKRYRKMVDGISDVAVKEAVAKGYHKLLAYKDEYEVARLHLETEAKAREQFDGDFTMKFHLAPPMLSKEGSDGRPVKKEYGPGMMRNFRLLARLKGLRGTPLDVFGRTRERRMERALIKQYEADMKSVLPDVTPETRDAVVALAALPLDIRGYGPVKEANEAKAAKRREEILAVIRSGGPEQARAAE